METDALIEMFAEVIITKLQSEKLFSRASPFKLVILTQKKHILHQKGTSLGIVC